MALRKIIGQISIISLLCTSFFCCANKQDVQQRPEPDAEIPALPVEEQEIVEEEIVEETVPAKKIPVTPIIRKKEVEPEPEVVPVVEKKPVEVAPKEEPKPEPKKEVKPAPKQEDKAMEEYKRSVAENTTIDYDTFAEDKKQILKIIEELIVIMKDGDDVKWRDYVEKSSLAYWSDTNHLAAYSKKLPQKGLRMKNLKDYFKWVFVPSRKGQTIDEIRYISSENIKAVQVRDDKDIVYYYFRKENGKWKIYLPTM